MRAAELAHRVLERRHTLVRNAENLEEPDPERLGVRGLVVRVGPLPRKGEGTVTNLVPGERHGISAANDPMRL